MRSAVVFVTCLCLLGMHMPRAACQDAPVEPSPVEPAPSPAEQPAMPTLPPALGVDLANVLLGEWVLEDPIVRVPTEAEPSGIAYMSGFSIDQQVKLMVNQSDLNRDNLALSEELQRLVVERDKPNTASSSFIVVAANPISGATVGYNIMTNARNRTSWKRNVGYARRTSDGKVVWKAGEQTAPAEWEMTFSEVSPGQWEMEAIRLQPYQMTNKNNTIVERQSVLTMLPFTKTDAPLTELLPRVAELFA